MSVKKCILDENKICDECGECDFCDLNPFKRCDNCGKCLELDKEYRELKIDDVIINGKSKLKSTHHEYCDDECCDDECCDGEHHHTH